MVQLFTLPSQDTGDDESLLAAFRMAASGEPIDAIKAAVTCFLTGRAGNGWRPSSAEFGIEVRRHSDPLRERLRRERARDVQVREMASSPASRKGFDTRNHYALEVNGRTQFSHMDFLDMHRRGVLPTDAFWRARDGKMFLPNGTTLREARL